MGMTPKVLAQRQDESGTTLPLCVKPVGQAGQSVLYYTHTLAHLNVTWKSNASIFWGLC